MPAITNNPSHRAASGFTLIEVLVVAPIIILLLGVMIGFIVALTGDALQARARSQIIYDVNTTLDRLEEDVKYSYAFRDVSYTPPNVQSANGSGDAFQTIQHPYPTDTYPLGTIRIMRTYATDKNPTDPTRRLIYSTSPTPSACGTADESDNTPVSIDIVYFIKRDSGTSNADYRFSLWRRILHNPSQTACSGSTIWQRRSCTPGYTDTTTCQTEDERMLGNIPVAGIGGYYSRVPDRSWTPSAPYAPTHYIDCINPCPVVASNPGNTLLDPYSRDGSGNPILNAPNTVLYLYPVVTIAGEDISYYASVYARRLNAVQ